MPAQEWQVGDLVLGLYRVTAEHREGGMGLVHRVRHTGWDTDLAVKSPRPELFRDDADRDRFVAEAETWVGLGLHPHVCGCHYVRTVAGVPRVFAEYVGGGSLRARIDDRSLYRGGPGAALARILDIAVQVAWGLAYAHRSGVVHQDVKPGNVLLDADGTAKITDFGLARARHLGTAEPPPQGPRAAVALLTAGGLTPAYASPEQVRGAPLDGRTDEYSFAVSVLEMFTGEVTWEFGPAAGPMLLAHRFGRPPGPPLPPLPGAVADLLDRCLNEESAERHGSMTEVATGLAALYGSETGRPYPRRVPEPAGLRADELSNRAMSLIDLDRRPAAEELLTRAHEADPQHPESVYNLGLLQWRAGSLADDALLDRLASVRDSGRSSGRRRTRQLVAQVHLERGAPQEAAPLLAAERDEPAGGGVTEALRAAARESGARTGLVREFAGHPRPVHAVSLTPDARLALSGGVDGEVLLWDAASGRRLHALTGHRAEVQAVSLSQDGARALSGDHSGRVCLWDTATGRLLGDLPGHTASVRACCLSADGRTAVTGGWDGTLRWWDTAARRCLRVIGMPSRDAHPGAVDTVVLGPDGETALVGSRGVGLWHLPDGRCLLTLEAKSWPIALSRAGRHAVTREFDGLAWWALPEGRLLRKVASADPLGSWTAAMGDDGRYAVCGANGGTLRWWDLAAGRCLRTEQADSHGVSSVALSADGRTALTGGLSGAVRLWRLPVPGAYTAPYQICRPRSHRELTRHEDRVTRLLTEADHAVDERRFGAALERVTQARALPGHERDERALDTWHRLSRSCTRTALRGAWPAGRITLPTTGTQVRATADGRRALAADLYGLRLWDLESGACLRTFDGHDKAVECVALGPDEDRALSGGVDGTVRWWDVASGRCLWTVDGRCGPVGAVCFSPDGRLAYAGGADGSVQGWELASGRRVTNYRVHASHTTSLSPHPVKRLLLSTGHDLDVRLWEPGRGTLVRLFPEINARIGKDLLTANIIFAAQLTPDTRRVVTTGNDGRIRIWDADTSRVLHTVDEHARDDGSADEFNELSVSADSRYALAGGRDTTVRVLDLATGRWVRALAGHTRDVRSVHLSAEGRYAVSTGFDATLRRWELDWELAAPR